MPEPPKRIPVSVPVEVKQRREVVNPQPFQPSLGQSETGYYVTVDQGFVVERLLTAGESEPALIIHECDNRMDGLEKTKFAIAVGEAIFVQTEENATGSIKPGVDVVLVVADAGEQSFNYIPTVQGGIYLYKLAELVADGDGVKLEWFLAGGHIYRDSGLTGDFRIMSCEKIDPEGGIIPPVQHSRITFLSGHAIAFDQSVEVRPLAETVSEVEVEICSG